MHLMSRLVEKLRRAFRLRIIYPSKKAYTRILIDYDPGRMHAKLIHSTKAALIDYRITWSQNVLERERAGEN